MIVDHKQAVELWCPVSMGPGSEGPYRCKGERCMAWRPAGDKGFCGMAGMPGRLFVGMQTEVMRDAEARQLLQRERDFARASEALGLVGLPDTAQ